MDYLKLHIHIAQTSIQILLIQTFEENIRIKCGILKYVFSLKDLYVESKSYILISNKAIETIQRCITKHSVSWLRSTKVKS